MAYFVFLLPFFIFFPVNSQTISECSYFRYGDANCDQRVSTVDFEFWRDAYFNELSIIKADFNNDKKANLVDLEILSRTFLDGIPEITGPVTNPSVTSVISVTPNLTSPVSPTYGISGTVVPTRTQIPVSPSPTIQSLTPTAIAPSRVPTAPPINAQFPSQVLDLSEWKVTVPIGTAESPTEVEQPLLATYSVDPWFVVSTDGGVRFRAPVNATTTSGSNYPRSELREMKNNGQDRASWSSNSGVHSMYIDQMITAVPQTKQHVVAGQIHDASDDVIVIRLEYPKLFIDINGSDGPTLDANYTLGERFQVQFVASNGQTKILYKGAEDQEMTLRYTLNQVYSGAYFKAGAYTQSNCGKEATTGCNSNNFGEVVIYDLQVSHE